MNIRLMRLVTIIFVTVAYISGCGSQKKEIRLAYKFPADRKYHFTYDSKISVNSFENNKLIYSDDKSFQMTYTQEVLKLIDSTTARLKYTYKLIGDSGHVAIRGIESSGDSWSTECVMASNGKIVDLPGDSLSNESLEYYRRLFEQSAPIYPSESISEGYKWSHTFRVRLEDGLTDAVTTYTVKAFVREGGFDCAVIEYKGNMVIPLGKNCSGDKNAFTSGVDRIQVEGVAYFAYVEGIVVREEESSHLVREGSITREKRTTTFKIDEIRNYYNRLKNIEYY
jgi:hypothetical protein